MARTRVPSSQIDDVSTNGPDLVVKFKAGGSYGYQGAAHHEAALLDDKSPGSYLHREIKSATVPDPSGTMVLKYPAVKL